MVNIINLTMPVSTGDLKKLKSIRTFLIHQLAKYVNLILSQKKMIYITYVIMQLRNEWWSIILLLRRQKHLQKCTRSSGNYN